MSNVIVLHQFEIPPFCQKVAKALRHKGIAFDSVDYNGMASTKAQLRNATNNAGFGANGQS